MTINLKMPDIRELQPRITVFGVGGAGGNAVNNMITAGLIGCDFVVANTDAQALTLSKAERIIQMGIQVTEGLGAADTEHGDPRLELPDIGHLEIDGHGCLFQNADARVSPHVLTGRFPVVTMKWVIRSSPEAIVRPA